MNNLLKQSFFRVLLLALLTLALPALAKDKSESELIQDLALPAAGKVTAALQALEKQYPTSTNALPAIKKLLTDNRLEVRRKAARVLGALHTDVDAADVQAICALLKSGNVAEMTDALKALRGLNAPSAVPELLPLLKNSNSHIVRDACRTLAILGNKDTVAAIEPLLNNPEPAVKTAAVGVLCLGLFGRFGLGIYLQIIESEQLGFVETDGRGILLDITLTEDAARQLLKLFGFNGAQKPQANLGGFRDCFQ